MRLDGAGQTHDGAAEGKGLQAEEVGILAERDGGGLVLADGAQHASPRAADQPLKRHIDHQRHRAHQQQIGQVEQNRIFLEPTKGPRNEADAEWPAGDGSRH